MNVAYKAFCNTKKKKPNHYNKIQLKDCTSQISILLGPNGTGKSMSLKLLEEECKKKKLKYLKYSNEAEDIVKKAGWDWDPYKLACAFHSEGERMHDSFFEWANSVVLKELLSNEDNLYIMIDELDSGLSFDRIYYIAKQWLSILTMEKEKHPNRIVKFIFTANSYEMVRCFKSDPRTIFFWIPSHDVVTIKNYRDFENMYMEYYQYMYEEDKDESNDMPTNERKN